MPTSTTPPQGGRGQARSAASAVSALLAGSGRPDLEKRLAAVSSRLEHAGCAVLVVGEFKKGKSSLVNALVNAPICPVDDDVATARPIEVRHSDPPCASIVLQGENGATETTERTIDLDDIPAYASEPPTGPDAERVISVRVGLPRRLLASGLVLVDTPGVGGLGSMHSAATIGAIPSADAVLFVVDASQELTAAEIEFLRTVRALCPTFALTLTKTDFYPAWRQIYELDRGHLDRLGFSCRIIAVSTPLREAAVERNDAELNRESGYAELVSYLRDDLADTAERESVRRTLDELVDVVAHFEVQLKAELAILDDPEESAKLVRQLEVAKEQADRLRGQAARWQQTLNDGHTDLSADVEHDLRARMRDLLREAEDIIDGDSFDPARSWDEFEPWLSRQVTAEVVQNYTFLQQRAVQLAAQVAHHFEADHREIAARLDVSDPLSVTGDTALHATFKADHRSTLSQAVSALRGTSGGMLMLNVFAGMAGIAVAMPVLAAVGVMLGRKALRDERVRALAQRRLQAKQSVRKYTDDVQFTVNKDSRDTLRRVNRQLRDHFLRRAEEVLSATSESLAAANQALRSTEASRTQRRKEVVALLAQLGETMRKIETEQATLGRIGAGTAS